LAFILQGTLFIRVKMNAGMLPFLVSPDLCIIKENLISFGQFLIILLHLTKIILFGVTNQQDRTTMQYVNRVLK